MAKTKSFNVNRITGTATDTNKGRQNAAGKRAKAELTKALSEKKKK